MKNKLKNMKTLLLGSFLLGLIFFIISNILLYFAQDWMSAFCRQVYGIEREDFIMTTFLIMGLWKIALLQFFLIPALVLWYMIKTNYTSCDDCE